MINKLKELLEVQSFTGKDVRMRAYLAQELSTIAGVTIHESEGNIYATKGIAPYPCVVSHIDTVHKIVEDLTAIQIGRNITGFNTVTMEQTGIGGDDKVGIFVCLQMLKEHNDIKVAFFRDEEVGCLGSRLADKKWFDDVTIVLQCDRKGNTDFVTNASGIELSSKAFQNDVLPVLTNHGYKFSKGMMTDVMELKEQGILPSMANISCGYYNPHSENEYVNIDDVVKVLALVSEIIYQMGATYYPHEYIEVQETYDFGNWWDEKPYGLTRLPDNTDIHNTQIWCKDCNMRPATGVYGFCDTCWDWYKEHHAKPDIRTEKKSYKPIKINFGRRKWKKR